MKVRIKENRAYLSPVGSVVDIPDFEAQKLLDLGLAEEVKKETKKSSKPTEGKENGDIDERSDT